MITQATSGVDDEPEAGDRFGWSLASLDLDCSGKSDLLVGAPYEDAGRIADAGAVHALFGTFHGPVVGKPPGSVTPPTYLTQDSGEIADQAESSDLFGFSLAWGILPGSGSYVAIGAPDETLGSASFAGAVHVLFNRCGGNPPPTTRGLTPIGSQFWNQDVAGVPDVVEAGDQFGFTLTTGAFTSTDTLGPASLVIGVVGEDLGSLKDAGAVTVLPPSPSGPTAKGAQFFTQGSGGVLDTAEAFDRFGEVLTTRNLNNSGPPDLVIGVPREGIKSGTGMVTEAGVVQILFSGGSSGLSSTGNRLYTQATASGSSSPTETVETGDRFGSSLSPGGILADNFIAIGAPYEDLPGAVDAGVVHVLFGEEGGPSSSSAVIIRQADTPGESAEANDLFGYSLSAWNYDAAGSRTDLAIGVPYEDITVNGADIKDAGEVMVYFRPGGSSFPSVANVVLTQADVAEGEGPEEGDGFGMAMY